MKDEFVRLMAKRRWLKRLIIGLLPRTAKIKIDENVSVYYDVHDFRGPSFYIMYDGPKAFFHYEQRNKEALLALLDNESVFFDIGANIGLFSLDFKMKKPGLRVFAFEPEALAHRCLKNSADSFKGDDFNVLPFGLGAKNENLKLYSGDSNSGGHTLSNKNDNKVEMGSIEIKRLDDFVSTLNLDRIDAMKIDVEGHEYFVVKGAIETIRKFRPAILFECWYEDLTEDNNLVSLLQKSIDSNFTIKCQETLEVLLPHEYLNHCQLLFQKGIKGSDYLIVWGDK